VLAACSSPGTPSSSWSGAIKGTVVVFAAASLNNAFDKVQLRVRIDASPP
jgi:hypothetical protein